MQSMKTLVAIARAAYDLASGREGRPTSLDGGQRNTKTVHC
jgi:hypothetical protein